MTLIYLSRFHAIECTWTNPDAVVC